MDIRSLAPASAIKAPEIVPAVAPVVPAAAPADDAPTTLEPAAQVDLSPEGKAAAAAPAPTSGDRAKFTRDADTQALVFQVVDQGSGQVVVQLPDEHALRARAYARELAARQDAAVGTATDRVA